MLKRKYSDTHGNADVNALVALHLLSRQHTISRLVPEVAAYMSYMDPLLQPLHLHPEARSVHQFTGSLNVQ